MSALPSIRVKLVRCEDVAGRADADYVDLLLAVNVKEAEMAPGNLKDCDVNFSQF